MTSTITDRLYGESSSVAVKAPVVGVAITPIAMPLVGLVIVGGYTPSEGDRVLLMGQANPIDNGIYNASALAWQRTGDFDGARDVVSGTLVIYSPPSGPGAFYQVTSTNPIIPGTSPLTFVALYSLQPPSYTAQTVSEANAGAFPVFTGYPLGNLLRYGLLANNPGAAANNTLIMRTLFNPNITNGPTGRFWTPNQTGADKYYFTDIVGYRDGCHVSLEGTTWHFTKSGADANATDAGFFFAVRDFTLEEGDIEIDYSTAGSNQGHAIQLGARGDQIGPYFDGSWDSLLTVSQGHITLRNLRIKSNNASGPVINMFAGLDGVDMENISIDGQGVCTTGCYYEFGWHTNETYTNQRQTSHARNVSVRNCSASNMAATAIGLQANGIYSLSIDGFDASGCGTALAFGPGESLYFRPATGVDDTGAKNNITLKNIVGEGVKVSGIVVSGAAAATGYLGWKAGAAVGVGSYAFAGANIYKCTIAGNNDASTPPSGTGTGIVNGTATYNYFGSAYAAETDLIHGTLEGFAFSQNPSTPGVGNGITLNGGKMDLRNGVIKGGFNRGIVYTNDVARVAIDKVDIFACAQMAIEVGEGFNTWSPSRKTSGKISNSYFAGNSTSSAGTFAAITFQNALDFLVENCRAGYETAFNGFNESFQGPLAQIAGNATLDCDNITFRKCHVGSTAPGTKAYVNHFDSGWGHNHLIEDCTGVLTTDGGFDGVLQQLSGALSPPTITSASPGNLSVAYTGTPAFDFVKKCGRVKGHGEILFTPTYSGGAGGDLRIATLPVPVNNTALGSVPIGSVQFQGVASAGLTGYTQLVVVGSGGQTYLTLGASGLGKAAATVQLTDIPSGTPSKLFYEFEYPV